MPASPEVPSSLRQAANAIAATGGQALQLRSAFDQSLVPMVLVDGERRHTEVNTAARLLARMSLEEMRRLRIDDLTAPEDHPQLTSAWAALMERGNVSGRYRITFQDGSQLCVLYAASANALPGQHLLVFLPADWPGDELQDVQRERRTKRPASLSGRQLDVLRLVAVGANAGQIAADLSISEATVRTHVKNILDRLGAHNRAHAVALAMTQGLLSDAAGSDSP